jgi:hypothetical protein
MDEVEVADEGRLPEMVEIPVEFVGGAMVGERDEMRHGSSRLNDGGDVLTLVGAGQVFLGEVGKSG